MECPVPALRAAAEARNPRGAEAFQCPFGAGHRQDVPLDARRSSAEGPIAASAWTDEGVSREHARSSWMRWPGLDRRPRLHQRTFFLDGGRIGQQASGTASRSAGPHETVLKLSFHDGIERISTGTSTIGHLGRADGIYKSATSSTLRAISPMPGGMAVPSAVPLRHRPFQADQRRAAHPAWATPSCANLPRSSGRTCAPKMGSPGRRRVKFAILRRGRRTADQGDGRSSGAPWKPIGFTWDGRACR